MYYKAIITLNVYTADTEEEARDIIINEYGVDEDEVEITRVGEE